jgi:hypothetical protein
LEKKAVENKKKDKERRNGTIINKRRKKSVLPDAMTYRNGEMVVSK